MPRILLFLTLLSSLSCATQSLHTADWLEVTSPHFRVVSSLGPEATMELSGDLERMRYATEFLLGERMQPASMRTQVYAFDDRSLARPFDLRGQPSYFLSTLNGGIIVLRTGGGWREDSRWRLRHDYAHHLLRNHTGMTTSLWLDEGFAQFLSTLQVKDESADLGITRKDHLIRLRNRLRLSLAGVLQMQTMEGVSEQERQAFEAEAWALIHYLSFEVGDPAEAAKRRRNYFAALASGKPRTQAFKDAFGMDEDSFERKLFQYVRKPRFDSLQLNLSDSWKPTPADIRPLSQPDAIADLGWLSIDLGKPAQARQYFKMALTSEPGNARAQAGLAASARLEGNTTEARDEGLRGLQGSPNHPVLHLEVGRAYHELARSAATVQEQKQWAQLAQEHYLKSIEGNPDNPAPSALLGETYLLESQDTSKAKAPLDAAQKQLPSSLEILRLRAKLSAEKGAITEARYHARTIRARTHSTRQSAAAQEILDQTQAR